MRKRAPLLWALVQFAKVQYTLFASNTFPVVPGHGTMGHPAQQHPAAIQLHVDKLVRLSDWLFWSAFIETTDHSIENEYWPVTIRGKFNWSTFIR